MILEKIDWLIKPMRNMPWFVIGLTFVLMFGIVLMILLPYAFIWSLNTLFKLGIAYTDRTWLAAVILLFFGISIKLRK